ncbi:MAG: polysaccharide pyruvyl transferase family protein [bacterium]
MKILLLADIGTNETGFYHVGDEAMFEEVIKWYKRHQPTIELGVLARSVSHTYLGISAYLHLPFPLAGHQAILYCLKLMVKSVLDYRWGINLFRTEQLSFVRSVLRYNILHFTGGGNIYSLCPSWLYYAFFLMFLFSLHKRKVIMTSQTIGPLQGIDRIFARYFLNLPSLIGLRKPLNTPNLLDNYGVDKPRIVSMLDSAYNLPTKTGLLLPRTKRLRIGISLHQLRGCEQVILESVAHALTDLAEIERVELVLIPHILIKENNKEWGKWYMKQLVKRLPSNIKVTAPSYTKIVSSGSSQAQTIKYLTSCCDVMVVTRYHGLIFSLSTNTPVLVLSSGEYYNHKNINALKFLYGDHYLKYFVDLGQPSAEVEVTNKLKSLISKRKAEEGKLEKNNEKLSKRMDIFSLDQLFPWLGVKIEDEYGKNKAVY